jgi:hypothetical protein
VPEETGAHGIVRGNVSIVRHERLRFRLRLDCVRRRRTRSVCFRLFLSAALCRTCQNGTARHSYVYPSSPSFQRDALKLWMDICDGQSDRGCDLSSLQ